MRGGGLGKDDIDGIAYTAGPGLVGAILVGATIGRSLAMAWNKPAIAVHHMEGHLLAPMLEERAPEFPFVALLVSGGHPCWYGSMASAAISCWASRSMMLQAKPSTRRPS